MRMFQEKQLLSSTCWSTGNVVSVSFLSLSLSFQTGFICVALEPVLDRTL